MFWMQVDYFNLVIWIVAAKPKQSGHLWFRKRSTFSRVRLKTVTHEIEHPLVFCSIYVMLWGLNLCTFIFI